ncbi:hypothetical protein INR49_011383 [Caranx melampygus]|nr:hypothetical protein INR49_011383 [Caranx melampygus]
MELKLQLCVFVLLVQGSLALVERVTVIKGQTLRLKCPLTDAHKANVDWKNPKGYVMFFNHHQALKDKRYSINTLSVSEFTISISNVTFSDGGNYTCSQYHHKIAERRVEVTVLGPPKMTVTKEEGWTFIKCTAEANHHPPKISWKLDNGPEILGHPQVHHDDNKYTSMDILHIKSVENRVTVKCLVRHPAPLLHPLMNFVKIGRNKTKLYGATTTSPTPQPQRSTGVPVTTTSWFRHGRTTVYFTNTDVTGPSSENSTKLPPISSNETDTATTVFTEDPVTSTDSPLSNTVLEDRTLETGTTAKIDNNNGTKKNITENEKEMQSGRQGNSSLLVFLVSCLIVCLLVVVIFFAIKLRRAHITWKRENEESAPSEESSKSKSSQEEKNSQGQRRRGIFNTAFTKYVVEEPTSVVNTGAMTAAESANKERTPQPQTSAKCNIKETEL